MSEKNAKPGRFQAAGQTGSHFWSYFKTDASARRLAGQLIGCLISGGCIALAHATGDMSTRLSLILAGVALAVGGFNAGALRQCMASKGGEGNG